MTPFHYKARILPDGHLPLPKGFSAVEGEEVDVTIVPVNGRNSESEAGERTDYVLKTWSGVGHGSGKGVAEQHDEQLYGN